MAKQGFRVMDSDLHVIEPQDLWTGYLDPKFQGRIETLLQRWDSKQHLLKQIGGKDEIVRRGKRRIADMDGEELLTKGLEDDLGSLLFGVESVRRDGSFAKPILSVRLTTGLRDEKSSWSPREAVPVWDAVVNSVRLRPGSV